MRSLAKAGSCSTMRTIADGMRRAGLRRDALSSQVIDALEGATNEETDREKAYYQGSMSDWKISGLIWGIVRATTVFSTDRAR
jgi:hypothetical protein